MKQQITQFTGWVTCEVGHRQIKKQNYFTYIEELSFIYAIILNFTGIFLFLI